MADDYKNNFFGEIEEIEDMVDKKFRRFKSFEVLEHPPSNHHYRFRIKQHVSKTFMSALKKDHEVLEANLPNSIFVRTYRTGIDLMRACLIPGEGSPYCYGLFFFDILLPSDYPNRPPEVFYHSQGGFDLHPDLHKDGTVSINLLGGKESKWNPRESNIFMVLCSIKYSILQKFDPQRSGKSYKDMLMHSCEAILYSMRVATFKPKDFEDFVPGHYRKRAHPLLLHYKSQMALHDDDMDMKKQFFKLIKAFEDNGAYCQHHYKKEERDQFVKGYESLEHEMGRFNDNKLSLHSVCKKLKSMAFSYLL